MRTVICLENAPREVALVGEVAVGPAEVVSLITNGESLTCVLIRIFFIRKAEDAAVVDEELPEALLGVVVVE